MSWEAKGLDELGYVSRGRSRHRPRDAAHLYGGPHPFVQTGDVKHAGLYLTEYTQTYSEDGLAQSRMWPAGTLCITIAANIADTAILGFDACFPDSVIGFIPDDKKADARFIKYLFDALLQRKYKQFAQGAAQDNLSQSKLLSLKFPIPGISEQKQIADVLTAYDDLIENNRRRIQLLEQAARLLYKEWFVHLRFPGHEHTRIIDGVPEGWEKTTFGDAVENFDRLRIPLSVMEREKRPGSFPYHGAAGILDHLDGFIFEGRFLLVGEDGTVVTQGNTAMLQLVEGKFWVSNHAHVVQGQLVSTEYLFCFMSHYPITGHITGVAQPKLSQRNLNRISMLIPPANLLDMFQDSAEPMFNQIFNLKAVCDRLAKARDLLLPKLMNGEVAV